MKNINHSFFNSADEANVHEMNFQKFEESLIYNILFQERLILQDAYYVNSRLLRKHIFESQFVSPLFLEASKKGLIIPALRNKKLTFYENLLVLSKETYSDNIFNYDVEFLKSSNFKTFINNAEKGLKNIDCVWKDESHIFSKGYKKIITEKLMQKSVPKSKTDNDESILWRERVWNETIIWRTECVEEAIEISGNDGLSRSEMFYSIARNIGVDDWKKGTHLDYNLKFISDPERAECLKTLWSWLNKCHHINLADKLDSSVNFPSYRPDSYFLADTLFLEEDETLFDIEPFNLDVEMSPIELLLNTEPSKLIEIRENWGNDYFESLKSFAEKPNISNKIYLEKSLSSYCEQISRLVPYSQSRKVKVKFGNTEAFTNIAGAISGVIGTQNTEYAIYCAITSGLCSMIPIIKNKVSSKQKIINSLDKISIEFTRKKINT